MSKRKIYAVGHNMAGYLPESETYFTSDHESAKRALIEDMDRAGDHLFDSGEKDEADELSAAMEDLNLITAGAEWGTSVGYISWWLNDVTADVEAAHGVVLDEMNEEDFDDFEDSLADWA